jgi:hypothetical protein
VKKFSEFVNSSRAAVRLLPPAAVMLLIYAIALIPVAVFAEKQPPPQLSGMWQLNEKESQTLQQVLQSMGATNGGGHHGGGGYGGGGGGGGYGGGGGGGYGGGHHGGGGGHHGGGGDDGGAPPADGAADAGDAGGGGGGAPGDTSGHHRPPNSDMHDLARPPLMMLIEQSDSTVVLSERGQTLRVMALGDPVIVGAAIEPDAPHVGAKWHGSTLIAEHTGPRGKLTQSFELNKDGTSLTIVTRFEGSNGRPPIELKRVYDKYNGD